jgi:beta-galactosidase
MHKQNLDRQWRFMQAGTANNWWVKSPKGTIVDLPHDYSIIQKRDPNTLSGSSNGFFPAGVSNYEKTIFISQELKGKKVMLEFEGVYMNATVRINNNIVAQHPYGYTSFHCNLTPYLHYNEDNTIKITVNNGALPNTRWYSGSGIYRHVWMLTGNSVHITPWGVSLNTPEVSSESSIVSVETTVENIEKEASMITIRSMLFDDCGVEVARDEIELKCDGKNQSAAVQTLKLNKTKLWSLENPYLYTLKSEVIKEGEIIDSTETKVGIRSISFDSEHGFQLNGTTVKLKGGCVHHDCGLLGAAAYDRAEERKVELLKSCGYNSVRCAHNPPSPAFLDACDRIGMLVIDEAFDCWREPKNPNDYGMYFEDWWQRDLASMVMRDRNHPSIIMWSIGNEIPERSGRSQGYAYAKELTEFVRNLDNTRAITNALNGISSDPTVNGLAANMLKTSKDYDYWGELSYKFVEPLDVVGYNYLRDRYEGDGKKFPSRVICGTESFPREAYDYWKAVESFPYVIGDYVWTSMDYLGEAGLGHVWYNGEQGFLGDYPWHQAYCGDIDICGFKRPQSYYRDCVWGISKVPYIAVYKPEHFGKAADVSRWGWPDVVSSWTWPGYEDEPIVIEVYSIHSEVELLINNKSLGRKVSGEASRYITTFETAYESGELTAVGYEDGVEVSRTILRTAGEAASIRLTPDRSMLKGKFGDLSYVTVELLDSAGNVVHNSSDNIYFTVSGVGSLLAVGTGNPITEEMYVGNQRRVYEGRAMAVLRCSGEKGRIVLTVAAEGIAPVSTMISVE